MRAVLPFALALGVLCCAPHTREVGRLREVEALAVAQGDGQIEELERLVNRHRRRIGLQPLVANRTLARVAQRHSEDMAAHDYMGHVDADGDDPFDRLRAAGIDYRAAGENVAAGHPDARAVFDAWMGSRGHRANIERRAFTHHGIGLHRNRWTHVFARLRTSR